MNISIASAFAASLCFMAAMIWALVTDLTTMKIRNEVVLFLLAIYAALAPLAGVGVVQIGLNAMIALVVLFCMFGFFGMGWIGGGDAKLIAVVALWVGADYAVPFILCTALFGGAFALILLQFRSFALPLPCLRVSWVSRLHMSGAGVPYGVAIASAAFFIFPETSWMAPFSPMSFKPW